MDEFTSNEKMEDHLAAFDHFIPKERRKARFDGTIIRLPLRTKIGARTSELVINKRETTPKVIERMFSDFIAKELPVVMLFLSNLSLIELLVRDDDGYKSIAKAYIKRSECTEIEEKMTYSKIVVTMVRGEGENSSETTHKWNLFHGGISEKDAASLLSKRLDRIVDTSELAEEKMLPEISLAFPAEPFSVEDGEPDTTMSLFTFLPLPIPTNFPAHVHALFALTSDRQNLLNLNETRSETSRDELVHQTTTV
jgi:hypothetical protein